MRILLIHNNYGKTSGEEIMFNRIAELLRFYGHTVECFCRSSAEISSVFNKVSAFFSGIYSFQSRTAFRRVLEKRRPDVAYVQNVFPLISPSVLGECRRAGIPVVMTVHNYRLVCPNGLHMVHGQVCEKCCGDKEYWCLLKNCEASYFKSLGYFLRNYVARKLRLFKDNVTMYACLSEFQRQKLIIEGFDGISFAVIPNMVDATNIETSEDIGNCVGFVGRISPEKGVDTLVEAARKLPNIRFKATGAYDRMQELVESSPDNFSFNGYLDKDQLNEFYNKSMFIVLSSICYETFGLPIVEAALRGKPVIASRIGGIPEIIDDGVTGLLFEPGSSVNLAEKIRYLWDRPELCRKMGQAGREKALREYSPEKYYERLMAVCEKAIKLGP